MSYTAQHVNATVTYTKYKCTATSVQTTATITSAAFSQDGSDVVTNFVPTDSSSPKTVGSQDYTFSPEVVAYKVSLKIENDGNFEIAANLTTPTPNAQNDNWFIHVVGQDSAENIAANTGEATIDVYLALTDLSKNVVQTNIEMSLNIEKFKVFVENGVTFNNASKTVLLSYPQDRTATTYTIPNTVTTIAQQAFMGNTYLQNVTMPDSVITIGAEAFKNCTSLTQLTLNNVGTIGQNAFCDVSLVTFNGIVGEIKQGAFSSISKITVNANASVQNFHALSFYEEFNINDHYHGGDAYSVPQDSPLVKNGNGYDFVWPVELVFADQTVEDSHTALKNLFAPIEVYLHLCGHFSVGHTSCPA